MKGTEGGAAQSWLLPNRTIRVRVAVKFTKMEHARLNMDSKMSSTDEWSNSYVY